MGIFCNLIWAILHLTCVAIDVAILVLICRIIAIWRRISWVVQINDATEDLVNRFNAAVSRLWRRLSQKQLSYKAQLVLGLLILLLGRLVLCDVTRLFW